MEVRLKGDWRPRAGFKPQIVPPSTVAPIQWTKGWRGSKLWATEGVPKGAPERVLSERAAPELALELAPKLAVELAVELALELALRLAVELALKLAVRLALEWAAWTPPRPCTWPVQA